MKEAVRLFFVFLIFLSASGLSAEPTERRFGEEWKIDDKHVRSAELYISWSGYRRRLMREPVLVGGDNWLNKGVFPTTTDKDIKASLTVQMSLDEDGKIYACLVSEPAKQALFNDHVCPHLRKYAKFHPPLTESGERTSIFGNFYVVYEIETRDTSTSLPPVVYTPAPRQPPKQRRAELLKPISASELGITDALIEAHNIEYVSLFVDVDQNGKATRCRLSDATYFDQLDREICVKMMAQTYRPAISHEGKPVDDSYSLFLSFVEE